MRAELRVLNAFRHPRIMHSPAWSSCGRITTCAQRLPASEDHARLRAPGRGAETPRPVLNAFRHPRIMHPREQRQEFLRHLVLNAFRHPRIMHSSALSASATLATSAQRLPASEDHALPHYGGSHMLWTCSTPSGIRGSCTRQGTLPEVPVHQVLNAFRHPRIMHPSGLASVTVRDGRCSTPSGIRGSCTPCPQR